MLKEKCDLHIKPYNKDIFTVIYDVQHYYDERRSPES